MYLSCKGTHKDIFTISIRSISEWCTRIVIVTVLVFSILDTTEPARV